MGVNVTYLCMCVNAWGYDFVSLQLNISECIIVLVPVGMQHSV